MKAYCLAQNTMKLEQIKADYVDFATMADEMGVSYDTVSNWARSLRKLFDVEYFFDKPLVTRADFERFKREHSELIQAKAETA